MITMTPCIFSFDDGPAYDGFAYGTRWNGFDNVAVTPAVRDEIARDFLAEYDDEETVADIRALPVGEDGLVSFAYGYATFVLKVGV